MPEDKIFSDVQEQFIVIFTEKCICELEFKMDIKEGGALGRPTYFDDLIDTINFGANFISALSVFFAAAGPKGKFYV